MTTISGTIYDVNGDLAVGRVVRAYRRDNGALLGSATTSDGLAVSPPGFKSATIDGLGAVADGDLVILFFLAAGTSAPSAPTGWTRILNTTEGNSYAVAVYTSVYSASNAVPNGTNFPVANGYFLTMVYQGPATVHQIGAMGENTGGTVVAPALTSDTSAQSHLIGWASSRDNGTTDITASGSMTRRLYATSMAFFDAALFEESGVQSGSRTFTRNATSFNFVGVLLEVKSSVAPLPEGEYLIDCGGYTGEVQRIVLDDSGDPLLNDLIDRVIPG